MMEKIVEVGSWPGMGENPVQLVKMASRGLTGQDRRALEKRASALFVDRLDRIKVASDEIPIHVLALGATEKWGCFVAGTEVRVGDGGLKRIEDIQIGEEVVTHRGRRKKVITTYRTAYDGAGIRLDVSGMLDTVTCTDNHKFYVIPKEQVACSIDKVGHSTPGTCGTSVVCECRQRAQEGAAYEPVWRAAGSLRPGDYVLVLDPARGAPETAWKWTNEFAWNGYVCRPVRIVETLPLAETVYNLEVEGDHSYTVGNGIAVKNCNRNYDGFTEQTCRDHHTSFVKNARHYEHHRNKDPDKSFGDVRLSAYNEPMSRVELLVIGNRTKEAAKRNGGLVLPESVITQLERGDEVPWSMACKVAFDKCSNCGNEAPSRADYCTEDTCHNPKTGRKMPGCRYNLGKMAEDGFQLYVDNPRPLWFDISRVRKPADRNAYGWKADYVKSASAYTPGGAELAEMYAQENGFSLLSPEASQNERAVHHLRKIAHLLANTEGEILVDGLTDYDRSLAMAFTGQVTPDIPLEPLAGLGTTKQASALAALARSRVLLSPTDFVRALTGTEKAAYIAGQMVQALPGVFNHLATDPGLDGYLRTNAFVPSSQLPSAQFRSWAAKCAESRSVDDGALRYRAELATILGAATPTIMTHDLQKTAAAGPALELAKQYALYKIAAISHICDKSQDPDELLLRAAVLQNVVVA